MNNNAKVTDLGPVYSTLKELGFYQSQRQWYRPEDSRFRVKIQKTKKGFHVRMTHMANYYNFDNPLANYYVRRYGQKVDIVILRNMIQQFFCLDQPTI